MIKKKIESIITDNGENPLFSIQNILRALSFCFSAVTRVRTRLYQKHLLKSNQLPCKVISIGNIAVGGTGKTPMTIYTAQLVQRLGYKTAVISRGYKGDAENTGGIVSDGKNLLMDYDMAGDEAFMMALKLKDIPVLVGKDRFQTSMIAMEKFNPDVVILDDAFQHLKLERDLDLVLLDHDSPFGNGYLLPRGTLREPASALSRSDAIIFTRSKRSETLNMNSLPMAPSQKPVFKTAHTPYVHLDPSDNGNGEPDSENILKNRNIYIFSGIAKNIDFQNTVQKMGARIVGISAFPDHHKFSDKEIKTICQAAKHANADIIATTEKNYAGIKNRFSWPCPLAIIGICITFFDPKAFDNFIEHKLVN